MGQAGHVLAISGSPSSTSRTAMLLPHVEPAIRRAGYGFETLAVRELPAEDLLLARADAPGIRSALARVEAAAGIVIATPVYKGAYSGALKAFLDVMPQFGLAGKTILPLATGGSMAHVLAIDYALRPVLMSMNPLNVVMGLFVLDKQILPKEGGGITLEADLQRRLDDVLAGFLQSLDSQPPRQSLAAP